MKRHQLSCKGDDHTKLIRRVLYNVMNEKTTAALWCMLESLYMAKSLSNKLFMKKQLYSLRMKKSMPILHLNAFNRILSDLFSSGGYKLEKDKALYSLL